MDEGGRIPTNLRLLRILEVVSRASGPVTASEINRDLDLPKQSLHRLCATLAEDGYLVAEAGGRRLRPGRRLRQMSAGILHASRFHIARHQVLERVAQQVQETVNFVVPEDKGMTYLDRVETDWSFRVQLPIGTHVPFHCTASGKVFLSSLPAAARRATVASLRLESLTPNTHTDGAELLSELKLIAKQGYALDREEFVEGMVAIAVPVRDPSGRYVASLAFHGPILRLTIEAALAQREVLVEAAADLQAAMFS